MDILFLAFGFVVLMFGGEFALRGTVGLARFVGVSPAVIGAGALVRPLSCDPRAVRQGGVMLTLLAGFMWMSYQRDRRHQNATTELHEKVGEKNADVPTGALKIIACILGGLVGLAYGAALLVESAVAVAEAIGISQSIIGLTLIAFGTSVPELTATIIAAYRHRTDVAVANVLGSNIFNILGVLGIGALFGPLGFSGHIVAVDQWIMLASAALLLPVMITGRRISRIEGAFMLSAYTAVNARFLY